MNQEQTEQERRWQKSSQTSPSGEENTISAGMRDQISSLNVDTDDVDGTMRWRGADPIQDVSSPIASQPSTAWSHFSAPGKASASESPRLTHMVEPIQEGRPLDSPLAPAVLPGSFSSHASHVSQSSFAKRYDQIASQIEEALEHLPPSPSKSPVMVSDETQPLATVPPDRPHSSDTFREAQIAFKDFDGVHFSPETDEFIEVDKEGHEIRRVSARSSSGGFSLEAVSMLRTPRASHAFTQGQPPPDEGMVYYPAPVPRLLNLPKRLSQLPSASVQAQRRSQVLGQLGPAARQSAPWLSQPSQDATTRSQRSGSGSHSSQPRGMLNERMSIANFNNLPPQLRASVFFDHQSVVQDVEVQSESAVATLDHILAASATAPVNAFTDHPYAGDVRKSVFALERPAARRNTTMPAATKVESEKQVKNRRSGSFGKLLRRVSSGNELADSLPKNGSRSSLLVDPKDDDAKLTNRKSQLSMTDDDANFESDLQDGLVGHAQNASPRDEDEHGASGSRPATAMSRSNLDDNAQISDDFKTADAQENIDEADALFAAPTTLLAELQVRKAQQKSRNRTAATAFPNGMHSTLLELDAVEEISRKKRKNQRVALAWENTPPDDDNVNSDDDVPLGMLYPSKDGATNRSTGGAKDWDRPLGLMAKRQLEDNEPLSSRRNRLRGISPSKARMEHMDAKATPNASDLHLAGQPDAGPEEAVEDETEIETLGQRTRRLKTKQALDSTVSDIAPKEGERPNSTFVDDVMSQFGGLDVKDKDAAIQATNEDIGAEPEETLGQRRARLQREREASGEIDTGTNRPPLRTSNSLSTILTGNPAGLRQPNQVKHQPVEGTLLHASAQAQAKQRAQLLSTNVRASSYGLERSLVDARPNMSRHPSIGGLLNQQQSGRAIHGGFAGGMYNNGLGGIPQPPPLQTSAGMPPFGMNGQNPYFASPTAGHAAYGGFAGNGVASMHSPLSMLQQQQYGLMNSMAYHNANGPAPPARFGFPSMPGAGFAYGAPPMPASTTYAAAAMGMGIGQEEPLDTKRRELIDRWRMSVAP